MKKFFFLAVFVLVVVGFYRTCMAQGRGGKNMWAAESPAIENAIAGTFSNYVPLDTRNKGRYPVGGKTADGREIIKLPLKQRSVVYMMTVNGKMFTVQEAGTLIRYAVNPDGSLEALCDDRCGNEIYKITPVPQQQRPSDEYIAKVDTVFIEKTVEVPVAVSVNISSSSLIIEEGESVTIYWNSTNTLYCQALNGESNWYGKRPTIGTYQSGPLNESTTFSIQAYSWDEKVWTTATVTILVKESEPLLSGSNIGSFAAGVVVGVATGFVIGRNNPRTETIYQTPTGDGWGGYTGGNNKPSIGNPYIPVANFKMAIN